MRVQPSVSRRRDVVARLVLHLLPFHIDFVDDVSVAVVLVMVENTLIANHTYIGTLVHLIPLVAGIGPVVFVLTGRLLRCEELGDLLVHLIDIGNLIISPVVLVSHHLGGVEVAGRR